MAMTQTCSQRARTVTTRKAAPMERPTTPAHVRRTLEDIAFVLHTTRRLSATIQAERGPGISAN